MPKYLVTIYSENYTDYVVTADSMDKARDKAMKGEYDKIEDATVKNLDPICVTCFFPK